MGMTATRKELLVDGSDQLLRQAIHDALGFSVRLHELRNGLGQAAGLTGPAYSILAAVEHLGRRGEVGVNFLSDHLHFSGAFVTTELNKLVTGGLVTKASHPCDKRRVLLALTASGQQLLSELGDLQRSVNDAIFNELSQDEFRMLARGMSKLVTGSDEALALIHLHARRKRKPA